MRGLCTLFGLVLLQSLEAQTLPVQQPHPPLSLDFVAANSARGWAVTAEITGSATRDGDVLKLFIKTCSLFRPERFPDPLNIVAVVSGISRNMPNKSWEILRRSERHVIRQSLAPGKRIELQPFELSIPIEQFAFENGDRITFQILNIYEPDGNKHGGYVPVHANVNWPDSFLLSVNGEASSVARFRSYADPAISRIAGEIDGRVIQDSGALTVTVDSCVLSSSDEYPDDERQIATIQVLIGRRAEVGKMSIERISTPYKVERKLKPGGTIALLPFELKLPLANYLELPTDWISLMIVSVTSAGLRETTLLNVPYELPIGQAP